MDGIIIEFKTRIHHHHPGVGVGHRILGFIKGRATIIFYGLK